LVGYGARERRSGNFGINRAKPEQHDLEYHKCQQTAPTFLGAPVTIEHLLGLLGCYRELVTTSSLWCEVYTYLSHESISIQISAGSFRRTETGLISLMISSESGNSRSLGKVNRKRVVWY
jgi:hypothetical protein